MPNKYMPGASNPFFDKHKFNCVPINRNFDPIGDCKIHHYVGADAKITKGIAVEILTPEFLWATFQVEAEDLIKVNGKFIEDDRERNKRISAAYARLWLADNRFQWAGLAAFASKQVGCGLLHAANTVSKNRQERERIQRSYADAGAPGVEYATSVNMGTEFSSDFMYKRLGFGNKHLFLDIYPLHRFYMERGWKEFNAFLAKRQNLKYPIHWEVNRSTLSFGKPFEEIRRGFEQIEAGDVRESVLSIARHEQVNILQAIMYNDTTMQLALAGNQFAWATGFPTGDYSEIQLTLSAQCMAQSQFTSFFSRKWNAKLWDIEQRFTFVRRAAERFHILLQGPLRSQVEESMRAIYSGKGVA